MKTLKLLWMMTGVVFATLTFSSCLDDDGYSLGDFWISFATVQLEEDNSYHYFKLDDGTTLKPAAGYYQGENLENRQRVILNYTLLSDSLSNYSHYVRVNDIDVVLTKPIAENKGTANDSIYGKDPVEMRDIWLGSGFLNIVFAADYGGQKKHFVNLLRNDSIKTADGSIYLEFRHNKYDDPPLSRLLGPVCFDLSSLSPSGEVVKLTIAVETFEGPKTYTLEYDPKKQEAVKVKDASPIRNGHAANVQ